MKLIRTISFLIIIPIGTITIYDHIKKGIKSILVGDEDGWKPLYEDEDGEIHLNYKSLISISFGIYIAKKTIQLKQEKDNMNKTMFAKNQVISRYTNNAIRTENRIIKNQDMIFKPESPSLFQRFLERKRGYTSFERNNFYPDSLKPELQIYFATIIPIAMASSPKQIKRLFNYIKNKRIEKETYKRLFKEAYPKGRLHTRLALRAQKVARKAIKATGKITEKTAKAIWYVTGKPTLWLLKKIFKKPTADELRKKIANMKNPLGQNAKFTLLGLGAVVNAATIKYGTFPENITPY
jgi:hypothetical protein